MIFMHKVSYYTFHQIVHDLGAHKLYDLSFHRIVTCEPPHELPLGPAPAI